MRQLHLAEHLTLPIQAVTETFGILAARGAGKSNTAAVMAEEMFKASLPFVVIDPVRAWYGLRSSRDGTQPGLPIPIFGGRRGDVPLERGAGAMIADLVADERLSCVLDVSEFESEAAKKQFLLDFAVRLYRKNEAPLHLFLEEADDYIPQRPMREEAQLLRAWENIVRRGRARGLGVTLITQRSAALNKNVLTQMQTLIAMRTTGPQDRAAIEEWLKYHNQEHEIIASLPGLKDGEAWVWSPNFLRKTVKVRFRLRETFDSGATPTVSRTAKPPATLADVDLGHIRTKMQATIEKALQEDPRELRRQLAEVKAAMAKAKDQRPDKIHVKVPALKDAQVKRLEFLANRIETLVKQINGWQENLTNRTQDLRSTAADIVEGIKKALTQLETSPLPRLTKSESVLPTINRKVFLRPERGVVGETIPKGERAILTAVAQHPDGVNRAQLTVLTGYKRSTRDAYIQRLQEKDYVMAHGGQVTVSTTGLRALGSDFERLPTGSALREHWLRTLPAGEQAVFRAVVETYPKAIAREKISDVTGYKRSTRDAYIQRLSTRRLVELDWPTRDIKAVAMLFTE